MSRSRKKTRVLAVSSGGGHWVQLLRLQPAFEDCDIAYATVLASSRMDIKDPNARFHVLPDATRWNKLRLLWLVFKVVILLLRERPHVIITTGAAPGYISLVIGKLLGRQTCWIDSIANVEELSMSGRKARRWATLWLTQWPQVARPEGPHYLGNVIASDTGTLTGPSDTEHVEEPEDTSTTTAVPIQAHRDRKRPLVFAISSSGGHWVELMRLLPAFEGCDVTFASASIRLREEVTKTGSTFHHIPDVTRWTKWKIPWALFLLVKIIARERPDVIITTGAAPGYLACLVGKCLGIRTCWVDSIANAEELSMSGFKAQRWINLLLTQWPKLAHDEGPQYKGNIL